MDKDVGFGDLGGGGREVNVPDAELELKDQNWRKILREIEAHRKKRNCDI